MSSDTLHRKRLESLGELAASLAHELNQPLNVIRITCENLSLHLPEDDVYARDKLDKIISQVERAGKIIGTVGVFSKAGAQRPERFGLRAVFDNVRALIAQPLSLQGITLTVEAPDDMPYLEGDAILLDQLLLNLVTNARDSILEARGSAPAERDEIRISVDPGMGRDEITIVVSDTGKGLGDVDPSEIFDPFFTTKTESGGSGLGLALCRKIAESLHGGIDCRGRPEGGAEFRVTLPVPPQRGSGD